MRTILRGFSRCVFRRKTKKVMVKIVHPGGHVELHNRPVLASEIMLRNPRCCVTHPYIFKQPWAIVSPDDTLFPGEKFYVVPIGTIRKLQKLSNFSTSPILGNDNNVKEKEEEEENSQKSTFICFSFVKIKIPIFLIKKRKKRKGNNYKGRNFGGQVGSSSSSPGSSSSSDSTTVFIRKRSARKREPIRRLASSLDNWQPNLEIIDEE